MAAYQPFTSSRTTSPDLVGLVAALRAAIAPEVGVIQTDITHFTLKKTAPWVAGEIAAAQTILDTFAAVTPELVGQHAIDSMDIQTKAFALYLLDRINIIHAALPTPLPPLTPAQALAGMRAKAGTL